MFAYIWLIGCFAITALKSCIAECCIPEEAPPTVEAPLIISPKNDYAYC